MDQRYRLIILATFFLGTSGCLSFLENKESVCEIVPDYDGDLLMVEEEKSRGTDPCVYDTDQDGLSDWEEIYETGTDPLKNDTDEDTLLDGVDPLPLDRDGDYDGDGVPDWQDIEPYFDIYVVFFISYTFEGNGSITMDLNFQGMFGTQFEAEENGTFELFYAHRDWPDNSWFVLVDITGGPVPHLRLNGNLTHSYGSEDGNIDLTLWTQIH